MSDSDEFEANGFPDDDLGMGHDPLQWLQEDDESDEESIGTETQQAPPETASTQSSPETVPLVTAPTEEAAETDLTMPSISASEPPPDPVTPDIPEPIISASDMSSDASEPTEHETQSFRYENHKAILSLPEKLSVQIIEPLHSEWKTLLYDLPQSLEVDASLVKEVDAAGLQLLYALLQQMVIKGSDVEVVNADKVMQQHFALFGLKDFFAQHTPAA